MEDFPAMNVLPPGVNGHTLNARYGGPDTDGSPSCPGHGLTTPDQPFSTQRATVWYVVHVVKWAWGASRPHWLCGRLAVAELAGVGVSACPV